MLFMVTYLINRFKISLKEKIKIGETFAYIGIPSENGYWPPHLHVQIIRNLLKYELDFPGTCTPNSIDYFKKVCPDPSVILGL